MQVHHHPQFISDGVDGNGGSSISGTHSCIHCQVRTAEAQKCSLQTLLLVMKTPCALPFYTQCSVVAKGSIEA
jgi:hypothetical protein